LWEFVAEEAGELLVRFEESAFPVSAVNVMPMLDLVDDGRQLPAQPLVQADAEDLADAIRGQPAKPDLAASLQDFVNGELALEDEIPAVLDLGDSVEPRQVHLAALLLGELWP
jgi:hypothetical protein